MSSAPPGPANPPQGLSAPLRSSPGSSRLVSALSTFPSQWEPTKPRLALFLLIFFFSQPFNAAGFIGSAVRPEVKPKVQRDHRPLYSSNHQSLHVHQSASGALFALLWYRDEPKGR